MRYKEGAVMKKRRPLWTINETHVELDERYDVVIKRLMAQNGLCRDTIGTEHELGFYCEKNGRFYISRKDFPYHLQGRCVANGAKTDISMYICYDKSHRFLSALSIVICIFYLIGAAFISFFDGNPIIPIILGVILGAVVFTIELVRIKSLKPPAPEQLPDIVFVMKDEVLKRIDAIKRWDE